MRPVKLFSQLKLVAKGCALKGRIAKMEWALCEPTSDELGRTGWRVLRWRPMGMTFDALWSEWEADLDPLDVEPGGYILVVRADSSELAYDAVPVEVSREPSTVPAEAGPETVFELKLRDSWLVALQGDAQL